MDSGRAIGPIGTVGRVALALGFVALALADDGVGWRAAVLGLVVFPTIL